MVLAAGLGTRLRPLTDLVPKPLVPIAGVPLIVRTLALLRAAGVDEVAINTHHRADQLRDFLAAAALGLRVHVLHEVELLGTGGGVRNALPFLGEEPFLVMNGDAVIEPDFSELFEVHERSGAAATMLLREVPDPARWGVIELDPSTHEVRGILGEPAERPPGLLATMFTGVHVLEPRRAGPLLPERGCIVRSLYRALLARREVAGALHRGGPFFDVGTPHGYLEANLAVAGSTVVIDPAANVAPGVRLDRVVAWAGARIDGDSERRDCHERGRRRRARDALSARPRARGVRALAGRRAVGAGTLGRSAPSSSRRDACRSPVILATCDPGA